jgi:DNA-binding GntR family transcriptional regulator
MARRALTVVSTQDALSDSLRERILAGEFAPGSALGEVEVATEYGVARPTARAVIQGLVHEGLLRREPNRSARVPELTSDDVRDLFYVREALEVQVVATLVERKLRPAPAEQAVRRLESLRPGAAWSDAVEADLRFHAALVEAVGSPRLTRAFKALEAEIRLCLVQMRPGYDDLSVLAREHRDLLEAVAAGPRRTAVRLMTEHLEQGVAELTASR